MERVHHELCHCSFGLLALCSVSAMLVTGVVYSLLA